MMGEQLGLWGNLVSGAGDWEMGQAAPVQENHTQGSVNADPMSCTVTSHSRERSGCSWAFEGEIQIGLLEGPVRIDLERGVQLIGEKGAPGGRPGRSRGYEARNSLLWPRGAEHIRVA